MNLFFLFCISTVIHKLITTEGMELRSMKSVIFRRPGIDDSLAIMYGLLHPDIDIVGVVTDMEM